ncbi:MAG: LamG domain-containing protein, partial [Pontiellaceae bacterium]|nr:LamG domain-containing protein [Pontiellaceae bacterium]
MNPAARAEGDQFLDGIGETALIARYVFDGNLEDASRNSLHASVADGTAQYAGDELFGKVLTLSDGAYITLPGQALNETESISVAGWLQLYSLDMGQTVFDLGSDKDHRFLCTCNLNSDGYEVRTSISAREKKVQLRATAIKGNDEGFIHLAIVLNTTTKELSLFANGIRVAQNNNVNITMDDILNASSPKSNHMLVGGSMDKNPRLKGKLHDIRFYRTALTERQVAVIHHNAISDEQWGGNDDSAPETSYREDRARQLNADLIGVENVTVKTAKGMLPELPYYVEGQYKD